MLTTRDVRRSRFPAGKKYLLSGNDFERLH